MKLHVPAISWFSKGAQISNSEKLRFVVLSPSHEKLTNTQPSAGSVGIGVGVGRSADVGAPGVDVGTGVGVDIAGVADTGEVEVSCPDPSPSINTGPGVDTGASVTGDGFDALVVTVFCAKT